MSTAIVSIITPTYNHERFIGPCIESVLAQTFSDWEMIIVDDASTDGTPEIVRRYDDPRITYIRQDHVGPYHMAETYNRALARARGEFIAILEGDDMWPPYKLERQIPIIQHVPDAVVSHGRAGMINEDGQPIGIYPRITQKWAYTADFLLRRIPLQPVTVVLRRTALSSIGGFACHPEFPAVDLPTWLRLSMIGSFHYSDVVLGLRREHAQQVTGNHPIVPAAAKVARDFFQDLSPVERRRIGVSESALRSAHARLLGDHSWRAARSAMQQGQWDKARRALRATLRYGGTFRRAEAGISYMAALARRDPIPVFERLAATRWGWAVVERNNALARYQRPELLVEALANAGVVVESPPQVCRGDD